jgi:hypothetical protein
MPRIYALLFAALTIFASENAFAAPDLPPLFSLELKREFSGKWSTLALEVIKDEKRLVSDIFILSQSVATVWLGENPVYMVVELYHVHENDMPVIVRLYSKKGRLDLDPGMLPVMRMNGTSIALKAVFEYSPKGRVWSGVLSEDTIRYLMDPHQENKTMCVSLQLKNRHTISGMFYIEGFAASYKTGFDWKLHYRPFWEATRLGRYSLQFNQ